MDLVSLRDPGCTATAATRSLVAAEVPLSRHKGGGNKETRDHNPRLRGGTGALQPRRPAERSEGAPGFEALACGFHSQGQGAPGSGMPFG
jgi:hypothetical protein